MVFLSITNQTSKFGLILTIINIQIIQIGDTVTGWWNFTKSNMRTSTQLHYEILLL